jgi:membrane associated rhomboid family serine protease
MQQQYRPSGFNILPPVVKNLMIINGLMFVLTLILQGKTNVDLTNLLGLHFVTSQYFHPFQIVTHMFMHGSFLHIFSNMFALWMFGSMLENVWGPKRFLFFYLACGLGGALAHTGVTWIQYASLMKDVNDYVAHPGVAQFATFAARHEMLIDSLKVDQFIQEWKAAGNSSEYLSASLQIASDLPARLADIPIVGASGAVFGVLIAFGLLFPNTYLYVYFLFPIKAKYFVIIYAGLELYAGFTGAQDGIAHFAHIGGAIVGFLLVKFWNRNMRSNFY